MRVEQRDHLIEARPSRVHNEQAQPFVAKQHAVDQQRVASSHAESRRLERPRSATRTSTHQRTLINDFQQPDVHRRVAVYHGV